jgi:hypothetical protein
VTISPNSTRSAQSHHSDQLQGQLSRTIFIMRSLCSTDAIFWEPAPKQETLAGIPHSIFRDLINHVFEAEVTPKLQDHCCDATAPCVVVRRAMQTCVPLLSVCKTWKDFVSTMLKDSRHSKLLVPATNYQLPFLYGSSTKIAHDYSLGGRYRAYLAIEAEYGELVVSTDNDQSSRHSLFTRKKCTSRL